MANVWSDRIPDLNRHALPGAVRYGPICFWLETRLQCGRRAERAHEEHALERQPERVHQGLCRNEQSLEGVSVEREGPDGSRCRVQHEEKRDLDNNASVSRRSEMKRNRSLTFWNAENMPDK